ASGFIAAGLVLGVLVVFIRSAPWPLSAPTMSGDLTRAIGQAVLTRWVLPFELLAVLFVAGLLGAIYFARPDEGPCDQRPLAPDRPLTARRTGSSAGFARATCFGGRFGRGA